MLFQLRFEWCTCRLVFHFDLKKKKKIMIVVAVVDSMRLYSILQYQTHED